MKNLLLIFAIAILYSCHKTETAPTPTPVKCPDGYTGTDCKTIIPDKFLGTYKCVFIGSVNYFNNSSNTTCTTTFNDTSIVVIKTSSNNVVVADSLEGTEPALELLSPTTFKITTLFYKKSICSVGGWHFCNIGNGSIKGNIITITSTGHYPSQYGTQDDHYTCTMTKQ